MRFTIEPAAPETPAADGEGFNWFGAIVTATPVLFVVCHLIWPQPRWLRIMANVTVLLFGTLMLSLLGERLARGKAAESQGFSLPMAAIGIVTLLGGVLTCFFGWASTAGMLGGYGMLVLLPAVWHRAHSHDE